MKAVIISALLVTTVIGAYAEEPAPVRVDQINGGAAVMVDVGRLHRIREWVVENRGKAALAVIGAVAFDRAAYNNNWVWYHDRARSSGGDVNVDESLTGVEQEAEGSQAINVYVANSDNVTISIRREP